MPCESCAVQFSVFRRKRACPECERLYCGACLRRGGGMCASCRALSTRPLMRHSIVHLKVRDLQCFLQRQNVSTRGCVEKEELISLCVTHVNSASYRRRGRTAGAFSSLKGLTTNLNDLLASAFELRPATPAPAPPARAPPAAAPPREPPRYSGSCYNSTHVHPDSGLDPSPARPERFTPTPGGEPRLEVPVPAPAPAGGPASPDAPGGARVDTADCFEVEDVDDAGWEFVARPAAPLPTDSELLFTDTSPPAPSTEPASTPPVSSPPVSPPPASPPPASPRPARAAPASLPLGRAASALQLPQSPDDADDDDTADSTSLQDEPLTDEKCGAGGAREPAGGALTLARARSWSQIAALSARQLKLLLARNRVDYRGCVERADLLQRARTLWTDHARTAAELESLPLEECCKICMAAPLECVLLECGHIAACVACARLLADCPICRQYVVRAVRCFRS